MPELPEVETVVRDIRPAIRGQNIRSVRICGYKPVLGGRSLGFIQKKLVGQRIQNVLRRGKHILIILEQGCLDIHLRMTGQLQVAAKMPAYTTFILELGNANLYFSDTRKFGRVIYHQSPEVINQKLGVEPLSQDLNFDYLRDLLKNKSRMIKPLLLDQKYIAGIGNIYADEVLFLAGINPRQRSDRISSEKIKMLCRSIKSVLNKAIKYQGTTFINFTYAGSESGNFQKVLRVFDRDGQPCKRCKTIIKKIWVGQRGTHFCPVCQKLRK